MPINPSVSASDGGVRLCAAEASRIRLVHLLSGLDEDAPAPGKDAVATAITGYTEWLSDRPPAVTVGWDWEMIVLCGQVQLRRLGPPRSNLLLQPEDQADRLLGEYVDAFDWQTDTMRHLMLHFGT
jgi:hypothetical protein